MTERLTLFGLILFFGLALATRLIALDERPMHTDEAVHGIILAQLVEGQDYRYDPVDYHGPTLYYLTLPWVGLRGQRTAADLTEFTLRAVPAFFGAGLILLLIPWRRVLGAWAVLWAALFMACSPIQLYFHRVFIHETLLVFFGFAFLTCVRDWLQKPRSWMLLLAGLCAGLMHATKATSLLMFAAMAGAGTILWFRPSRKQPATLAPDSSTARPFLHPLPHIVWAVITALAVSALLHSSFFTNPAGIIDSITAFFISPGRATGQGHEKPWYTYLHWIGGYRSGGFLWSEALLLILGALGAFFSNDWKARSVNVPMIGTAFLGLYALFLFVIYSLIPYKTPWLMLSPMFLVTLLAGSGAATAIRHAPGPWALAGLTACLLLGALGLAAQAHRAAFRFAADERVPYVYSHTSPDAVRLANRIVESMQWLDESERMVQVVAEEYWPLPWYLRSLDRVGYWNERPPQLIAPVIILSRPISATAQGELELTHVPVFAGIRPGVLIVAWFRNDLWRRMLEEDRS